MFFNLKNIKNVLFIYDGYNSISCTYAPLLIVIACSSNFAVFLSVQYNANVLFLKPLGGTN